MLRDQGPNSIDGLWKELSIPFSGSADDYADDFYARSDLETAFEQLRGAGLIVEADRAGTYEIAPNWRRAQAVLGFSLKEPGDRTSDSVVIKPFFGKPAGFDPPLDIFVLMSFKPKFRPIYEDHILNVAKELNLTAKRADDFFSAHHIMSDVWEAINAARVVIADCTERNANVFYEIGMAHTVGRTVILITQEAKDVPFDLQAIRYIHYEYTPPGMKTFEKTLAQTLQAELGPEGPG